TRAPSIRSGCARPSEELKPRAPEPAGAFPRTTEKGGASCETPPFPLMVGRTGARTPDRLFALVRRLLVRPALDEEAEDDETDADAHAPHAQHAEHLQRGAQRGARVQHLAADRLGPGQTGDPAADVLSNRR